MSTKIFVNLPVKDLNKSMEFFTKLGYKFNPQFTDEKGACMVVSDHIFVMLLLRDFFKTFTKKEIADTAKTTQAIYALSVDGKSKVDDMMKKVLKAGGTEPRPMQDYGWMYSRTFQDLDGHTWEVFYMDEKARPKTP